MNSGYIFEATLNDETITSLIQEDKKITGMYNGKYPVRFILLDNFQSMRKVVDILRKNEAQLLDLSTLENFQYDDGWIGPSDIEDIINHLSDEKDYVIVPISEIIRFTVSQDFSSLLTTIVETKNRGTFIRRRIYIPIVGLCSYFQEHFFAKYHRTAEFSFVWKIGTDYERHDLVFFDSPAEIENYTVVRTTKEFLDLWKRENLSNSILVTQELLYDFSSKMINDEIFNVVTIRNYKEFTERVLKVNVPIEYSDYDKHLWEMLSDKLREANNFVDFVKKYLNVMDLDDFDKVNPLSMWLSKDEEFARWLMKGYYSNMEKKCYTKLVFSSLQNLTNDEALKGYYLRVFDQANTGEFLKERREILQKSSEIRDVELNSIEAQLEQEFDSIPAKDATKYVTGTTFFEKKWVISNIDYVEENELEEIYPELYHYLTDVKYDNVKDNTEWIIEYFREYRMSRVKNSLSHRLIEILDEKNANEDSIYKWYYSFDLVEHCLKNVDSSIYSKIWIDALGVEFLPLIVSYLEEQGFDVDFKIARCNLPSTTEFNRFEGVERIADLDNFIHEQYSYVYPDNLIKEISIVKDIVNRFIKNKDAVVIFSDHGFTAFANTKFNGRKILGVNFAEREGRYAEVTNDGDIVRNDDFFVYVSDEQKRYLIPTKYKFFAETSVREIHGGATPEEVLVPVIFACKTKIIKQEFRIDLTSDEIEIRSPILKVKIVPVPKRRPTFTVGDRKVKYKFDDVQNSYDIDLSGFRSGEYVLVVEIGSKVSSVPFKIKGGMKEKELL